MESAAATAERHSGEHLALAVSTMGAGPVELSCMPVQAVITAMVCPRQGMAEQCFVMLVSCNHPCSSSELVVEALQVGAAAAIADWHADEHIAVMLGCTSEFIRRPQVSARPIIRAPQELHLAGIKLTIAHSLSLVEELQIGVAAAIADKQGTEHRSFMLGDELELELEFIIMPQEDAIPTN